MQKVQYIKTQGPSRDGPLLVMRHFMSIIDKPQQSCVNRRDTEGIVYSMNFIFIFAGTFLTIAMFIIVQKNIIRDTTIKFREWSLIAVCLSLFSGGVIYFYPATEIFGSLFIAATIALFMYYKKRVFVISLLSSVLSVALIMAIQSGIGIVLTLIFELTPETLRHDGLVFWAVNVSLFVISFLASRALGGVMHNFLNSSFSDTVVNEKKRILLLITAFSFILLVFFYINAFMAGVHTAAETMIIINSILLAIVFFFIVALCYTFYRLLLQGIDLKHSQELLNNLTSYNISIENLYAEIRHFRHDAVNMMSSAYWYINNDDFNGWKKHFEKNIAPVYNKVCKQSDTFKQLENIKSAGLKGMLMIKIISAIESGSEVTIGIDEEVSDFGMSQIDLIRVLGILLDNAIDECRKKNKMKFEFIMYKSGDSLTLMVINEIFEEPPSIAKIFENGFSTKGSNRGVGLHSLQKIIDGYDSVFLQTHVKENEIMQKLTITLLDA